MIDSYYLVFRRRGALYGVAALRVREIIPLVELAPVEEMHPAIRGIANLRGAILPVMDLDTRFGRRPLPCALTDSIVVFDRDNGICGVLVSGVEDVRRIAQEDIEIPPQMESGAENPTVHPASAPRFVIGLAKRDEQVVLLLDTDRLLHLPFSLTPEEGTAESEAPAGIPAGGESGDPVSTPPPADGDPCDGLSAAERFVLRERAVELSRPLTQEDEEERSPIAVIRIGEEALGIPLSVVREFVMRQNVTPVPNCPPHIVGVMSVRGEIVSVVDIRPALGLPSGADTLASVALLECGGIRFGVLTDEILEVAWVSAAAIRESASTTGRFLTGSAPFRDRLAGVLDIPRLLAEGGLIVDRSDPPSGLGL